MLTEVYWPNFKRTINGIGNLAVVIVQDNNTKAVLMTAFTDEAGWKNTLETGLVHLYSTSNHKSWMKGETSGNTMKVVNALVDCDGDAIIYLVEPQGDGLACHTLAQTCFYRSAFRQIMPAPNAGEKEKLETRMTASVFPRIPHP